MTRSVFRFVSLFATARGGERAVTQESILRPKGTLIERSEHTILFQKKGDRAAVDPGCLPARPLIRNRIRCPVTGGRSAWRLGATAAVALGAAAISNTCGSAPTDVSDPTEEPGTNVPTTPPVSILPAGIDSAAAARLSQTLITSNFIFHMEPGDSVQSRRMEAFHVWAVGYLGISLPKKIDYYKFRTSGDLGEAVGRPVGGIAFPPDQALATHYSWHNHECFHIYNGQLSDTPTIRLFEEGMAVAHEFDPYNNDWVSRWNRSTIQEPYLDIVRARRACCGLIPIDSILESADFNRINADWGVGRVYEEAGVFVRFLIDRYGLEKMKAIFPAVPYDATRDAIKTRFQEVFEVSLEEAEGAYLAWLDQGT